MSCLRNFWDFDDKLTENEERSSMRKQVLLGLIWIWNIIALTACGAAPYEELNRQADFIIYTPLSEEVYLPVIREFESRYGKKAEVFEEPEEEIMEQVRMKRESFPGDIILGASDEAVRENYRLFPERETFLASSFVIIYNKNIVRRREAPENLTSLMDDGWNGKIGYPSPEKSAAARGLSQAAAASDKKEDEEVLRIFCEKLEKESTDSIEEIGRGVCSGKYMTGIVTKALAQELLGEGENIALVPIGAKECIVSAQIVSTIGGKNPEEAELFFEFATGEDVKRYLAEYLKYEPAGGKESEKG